jgi:hypothetical protein
MFGVQAEQVAQVAHPIPTELLEQQVQVMATAVEEVVAVAQQQEPSEQVEQVQLEQSSFIGKVPDPNDLPHKMYAIVENGIVQGYQWDNEPKEGVEFILMTFDNSPAWVGGEYKNGRFYEGVANA